MKKNVSRVILAILALCLMVSLSGCVLNFRIVGSDVYDVYSDGKVENSDFEEDVMSVDVEVTGFIPAIPTVLEVELEGLIMSMSMDPSEIDLALDTISDYLYDFLGFDSCTFDVVTDTFVVYGEFTLSDFLGAIGMSSPETDLGSIQLSKIIGTDAYNNFITRIAYVSGNYTDPATSIDYALTGALKTSSGRVVGSLELWFDGLNPAI